MNTDTITAERNTIVDLSFMADGRWIPTRTGDYWTDCAFGREAARELLQMIESSGNPALMSSVARAVAECGSWGGAEIGLFSGIGIALT